MASCVVVDWVFGCIVVMVPCVDMVPRVLWYGGLMVSSCGLFVLDE